MQIKSTPPGRLTGDAFVNYVLRLIVNLKEIFIRLWGFNTEIKKQWGSRGA